MEKQVFVTKSMTVGEVIKKYPSVVDIFQSFGLSCVGCSVNPYETLEQGTVGHGMSEDDMNNMIEEANEFIRKFGSGVSESKEKHHSNDTTEVIVLTEKAAEKVKDYMKSQERPNDYLKVSVSPGGCAGFTYGLEFVKDPEENDMVIEEHGVKIIVDKDVATEIAGLTVDYIDSLQGSGFKISNPNASSSCGCGKSFR